MKRLMCLCVFLASGALSIASSGCNSSQASTENLIPVSGCVKLNGEPLARASIRFVPRDGTKGTGGFAATDDSGHYELMKPSRAAGIEPGNYTVTFSKFTMPNGDAIPEGKSPVDVGARESLPTSLTMPQERAAKYVALVKEGMNTFDFDLKKGAKSK